MRQWKGDVEIGYRAYSEVLRIFPSHKDAKRTLGIRHENLTAWSRGVCPSAKYLARLHKTGADVIYILVGTRSKPI